MALLVTGGTGVIGSMIIRELVGEGLEPIVMARHDDLALLRDVKTKIKFFQGNILDFETLERKDAR